MILLTDHLNTRKLIKIITGRMITIASSSGTPIIPSTMPNTNDPPNPATAPTNMYRNHHNNTVLFFINYSVAKVSELIEGASGTVTKVLNLGSNHT